MHDSKYAGHYEMSKTRLAIERMFWWPGLRAEVEGYLRECPVCRYNESWNLKPGGLLQPFPIPAQPWDSVSFDFIMCRAAGQ
jgi:hypothetical protein